MNNNKQFRSIEEIPPNYQYIFNEYPCFNAIQSQVFDDILYSDNSVVVSSPTGSGKTALFELAIVRLLMHCENVDISHNLKIVYISPVKSLCQERFLDWHKKFLNYGLNCASITGDSDNLDVQSLVNHNLIISTPEKWDCLTRRWRDNEQIIKEVKLFMIDEVHLLNEENRGSTLEVIVSRMKTVENSISSYRNDTGILNKRIRFIALSATVPNVEDIAEWIGRSTGTKYYKFSEDMRPVKLKKIVLGYSYNVRTTSPFKFDISLNYKLQSLIIQYSEGKPTLIFCSTRKSVEMTANHLVKTLTIQLNEEQRHKLLKVAALISDVKAKDTIRHGVGYHHAGMISDTRHAIEELFRRGDLPVLVTTSTLAMGVNLPAHLVIIKSTKCYDNCGFRDYTEIAIHQMIGRAGRPQFDTSATALILTTNNDKAKFEAMVTCGKPIESNLHRHLTEHLNAEVTLRTITDLDVAMNWLTSTFLYVRARKNPVHYGLKAGLNKEQIDKKLLEICQIDLNKLVKGGMITMDQNIVITPTVTGQIMAKYYIAFETMKLFTQITGTEILIQILALISKCHEFSEMRLRVNDKKTLNLFNKNSKKTTIRFPLNGKIKTWDMKVNCIIQAVLGNLDILDHSILSESLKIMRNGERIAKCLIDYLETRGKHCYSALLNTIILYKCVQAKLWENSPYVSKQLSGIGSVMSNQLVNAGKTTFKQILESNPRDIEMIIKRKHPMGNTLIEEVQHIPSYDMKLETTADKKQLKLTITLVNVTDLKEKSTVNLTSIMTLLIGNNLNEVLVYEKYKHSYMINKTTITKFIRINSEVEEVEAHFISDSWVGIDCNCKVTFQCCENSKANKNNPESSNKVNNSNKSTYIQTFLDIYMKMNKKCSEPIKRASKKKEKIESTCEDTNKIEVNRPNNVELLQEPFDTEVIEIEDLNLGINKTDNLRLTPEVNDVKNSGYNVDNNQYYLSDDELNAFGEQMDKAIDEYKNNNENLDKTNLAISTDNLVKNNFDNKEKTVDNGSSEGTEQLQISNKGVQSKETKEEKIVQNPIINFQDTISKAPSLFYISQKYITDDLANKNVVLKPLKSSKFMKMKSKKRKMETINDEMEFEKSLYSDDKNPHLKEFKFPAKKKFSHQDNSDNTKDSNENKKMFAITDIMGPSKNKQSVSEFNLFDNDDVSKDERSNENTQKSIKWRSPLVFSPAVKFSPKICFKNISVSREEENDTQNDITNETFETSASSKSTINLTMNIHRTPNKQKNSTTSSVSKSRGTKFPLCDRDYDDSPDKNNIPYNLKEDISEICSTSFLDNMGFNKITQHKLTPRHSKKFETSPALDYYSQLLSQPIQAQKLKNDPQSKDIPNKLNDSKNNFEENKENDYNFTQNVSNEENLETKMYPEQPQELRAIRKTQNANIQNNSLPTLTRERFKEMQDLNSDENFILSQDRRFIEGPNFKYKAWSTLDNTVDYIPRSEYFDRTSGKYIENKTFNNLSRCHRIVDHSEPNFSRTNYNFGYPQNLNESMVSGNYTTNRTTQNCQCHRPICGNKNQNMSLRPIYGNNYHKQMDLNQSRFLNDTFAEDICSNQTHQSSQYFNIPNNNRFPKNFDHRFAQEYQMVPQRRNSMCSKYENSSQYFPQPSHTQITKYQNNYPSKEAYIQSQQSNDLQINSANEEVGNNMYELHQKKYISNEFTPIDEDPIYQFQKENDGENLQQASTSQICSQRSDGVYERDQSFFQSSTLHPNGLPSKEYMSDQNYISMSQRPHQGIVDHRSLQNSFRGEMFHHPHTNNHANARKSTMNLNYSERANNDPLMLKMLKKSVSSEENPNVNQRNIRSSQQQDQSDYIYRQNLALPDLNNPLRDSNYPNWDDCEQSFSCEHPSAFEKSFIVPPMGQCYQNSYFSPNSGQGYPSINDKEYVMNKFFGSLSND